MSVSISDAVYREKLRVRAYETTPFYELSPPSLVNYLQEVAGQHVVHLGLSVADLLEQAMSWVLMRLKVEINRLPKQGEEVLIETYPAGIEKYYVYRDFIISEANSGEVLVKARSIWLVIDSNKRRMISTPAEIRAMPLPQNRAFLPRLEGKFSEFGDTVTHQKQFVAHWHHLDINQHVNNAHYVYWLLEAFPADFLEQQQLTSLDILYRQESYLNETVISATHLGRDNVWQHRLQNASGKILAQAESTWCKR